MRMTLRACDSSQEKANREKMELARAMVGKKVVIGDMKCTVTGYSAVTGDAEIRIGLRTTNYDPRRLVVAGGA